MELVGKKYRTGVYYGGKCDVCGTKLVNGVCPKSCNKKKKRSPDT